MYNLKNTTCQELFKIETSKDVNKGALSSVFDEEGDLNTLTKKFMKRLEGTIKRCFKKIRIKKRTDEIKESLFKKWKSLKNKDDQKSKKELEDVEKELTDRYAKEYFDKIKERTGHATEDGKVNVASLWNLKKELFPQSRDPPTAMKDPRNGNLLSTEDKIQDAAVYSYTKRLENKPMKDNLKHIKDAKELLCDKIIKAAQTNITPPWEMKHLEKVLKYLKKNKSRDPLGLANELFRPEVAGDDLKLAVLKLMNKIKREQIFPECLQLCNISSIWKRKGPMNDFESYRGIFRVTIFRSILDRLIYNDECSNIDSNLTDCNVGARKDRNIRDNIFVINAITNSIRKGSEDSADFQVYDIEKCFDTLWLHEVINCLFNAGMNNDKLPLLFLENNVAKVAIKTSGGISRRVSIRNIIMQGSVWGSLCCVVVMDKLGQLVYSNPDLLYYYKGVVATPPLQMIDDVLGVQKCNRKSRRLNNTINTFIELEKLKLSDKKCNIVHIGQKLNKCSDLKVHSKIMHASKQETYLGDKLDQRGILKPTIESRTGRGYGAIANILAILDQIPLGHWRIQAGLELRQAMFLNAILCNSEAWQGIVDSDLVALERADEVLLRGIVNAHSKAPIESLYLETGSLPIRYIVKNRRLCYLKNIIQRDSEELISEIYAAQKVDPTEGDFCKLVDEDARQVHLVMDEQEIATMETQKFKNKVKGLVKGAAFQYLIQIKAKHSKMSEIGYNNLPLQTYMQSPLFTAHDATILFALRTRTLRGIKDDFRNMYADNMCPLECGNIDTIKHLLACTSLQSNLESQFLTHNQVKYEHVFSNDIIKQKEAT